MLHAIIQQVGHTIDIRFHHLYWIISEEVRACIAGSINDVIELGIPLQWLRYVTLEEVK